VTVETFGFFHPFLRGHVGDATLDPSYNALRVHKVQPDANNTRSQASQCLLFGPRRALVAARCSDGVLTVEGHPGEGTLPAMLLRSANGAISSIARGSAPGNLAPQSVSAEGATQVVLADSQVFLLSIPAK
jgi:hypothetical protein